MGSAKAPDPVPPAPTPPLPAAGSGDWWHAEYQCTAGPWTSQIGARVINGTGGPTVGIDAGFFNDTPVALATATGAHWFSIALSNIFAAGVRPYMCGTWRHRTAVTTTQDRMCLSMRGGSSGTESQLRTGLDSDGAGNDFFMARRQNGFSGASALGPDDQDTDVHFWEVYTDAVLGTVVCVDGVVIANDASATGQATFAAAVYMVVVGGSFSGAEPGVTVINNANVSMKWFLIWNQVPTVPERDALREYSITNYNSEGALPEEVFAPLSVLAITNPMDHGANGNGTGNDLAALQAAVTALPAAGGIVYFPPGNSFRKTGLWQINADDHVKLWQPCSGLQARPATIVAANTDAGNTQAVQWENRVGGGAFGLKISSDATSRGAPFEDNALSFLGCDEVEVVGCEISGAKATGVTCSNCNGSYIEHNYIHNVEADHIMRAYGNPDQFSYVWSNFNVNVSGKGDDGVSIVGVLGDAMAHDMETWLNTIIGGGGRGISVIGGGPNIRIHDNWCIDKDAAGLLFASESAFNSETVDGVTYSGNKVLDCCIVVTSHAGILVSGGNPAADPLSNIAGTNNWSVDSGADDYRQEGDIGAGVSSAGLQTTLGSLPLPIPTTADAAHGDTTVLRTRDTSHVAVGSRPGLYRIHITGEPGAFTERFEYVFSGTPAAVAAQCRTLLGAGHCLSEYRIVSGTAYALMLTSAPVVLAGVTPVTFANLRAGDLSGALSWLWNRVDAGNY